MKLIEHKSFTSSYIPKLCCVILSLVYCLLTLPGHATTADEVFETFEGSVYQVKIIELKSGSQSGLGTGFVVSHPEHGKLVATNYHVISGKVLDEEKYRVEVEIEGKLLPFSVVAVDVVNDLAILQADEFELTADSFTLADTAPKNGAILFSLGNPHDLGLTVVQGNYNGLVENKFFERIHFSGAVNPGMSGGPVVSEASKVVGINVATSRNQIGFLVPVRFLVELIETLPEDLADPELFADMAQQIASATTAMVTEITDMTWPTEKMEQVSVLAKTVDWMECWGDSKKDKDSRTLEVSRGCNNADRMYLGPRFYTAFFEYEFYYVEADDWPASAFYRALARNTGNARPGNSASKRDVGNFSCAGDIIKGELKDPTEAVRETSESSEEDPELTLLSNDQLMTRKVSYCVRAYQRLPGLFDVFYVGVSIDKNDKALMEHFTLSGVTQQAGHKFLAKFMEVVSWQ